jgi:hypothetical protein
MVAERWGEVDDRFARIEAALEKAVALAASFGIEVLGLYHSHVSDHSKVLLWTKALAHTARNWKISTEAVAGIIKGPKTAACKESRGGYLPTSRSIQQ